MRFSSWSSDVCSSDLLAGRLVAQVGEARAVVVGGERGADLADLARARPGPQDARQHALGLGLAALHDEVAQAVRDQQQPDEIKPGRDPLRPAHPAPRPIAETEKPGRMARLLRPPVITEYRARQHGGD